jgi:hypothetical protein
MVSLEPVAFPLEITKLAAGKQSTAFMKILKYSLLGIVVLFITGILLSYFLPDRFRLERKRTVACSSGRIYDLVFHDPTIRTNIQTLDYGKNSIFELTSAKFGKLLIRCVDVIPSHYLKHEFIFNDGDHIFYSYFRLDAAGDSTQLTWEMEGALDKGPVDRIYGVFMESRLGNKLETALKEIEINCNYLPGNEPPAADSIQIIMEQKEVDSGR